MSKIHRWREDPEPASSEPVSKQRILGVGADLVRVAIQAGTKASRHSHPFEQFVQVLAGSGTLETADGPAPFSAGSVFHFPAEAWHSASFDEDTILVETNLRSISA